MQHDEEEKAENDEILKELMHEIEIEEAEKKQKNFNQVKLGENNP